jgi:excisionase family DNA binding protein
MIMAEDTLLTIEELSRKIKKPIKTIYSYTSQRQIPHYKVGKGLLFSETKINAWLESKAIDPLGFEAFENE